MSMSAEGMGLAIGFGGLFITMIGGTAAIATAYGKLFTQGTNTATKLDKIDEDNRAGHKEIFDSLKSTDIKVGCIEQHLKDMNGKLVRNGEEHNHFSNKIDYIEERVGRLERVQ